MNADRMIAIDRIRDWRGVPPSKITDGIWQCGFSPFFKLAERGVDLIVLSACDAQPSKDDLEHIKQNQPSLAVLCAPLDDVEGPPEVLERIFRIAGEVGRRVAHRQRQGKNVLVTCVAGRNRSGLIAALALRELRGVPGKVAAEAVRKARDPHLPNGEQALTNSAFAKYLDSLPAPGGKR